MVCHRLAYGLRHFSLAAMYSSVGTKCLLNSARQRLLHFGHQPHLLRTREIVVFVHALLVALHFDVRKNLRRILHLVDDGRLWQIFDEEFWVLDGGTQQQLVVKSDVSHVGIQLFKQRGFPHLPRARNENAPAVFCPLFKHLLYVSLDIHIHLCDKSILQLYISRILRVCQEFMPKCQLLGCDINELHSLAILLSKLTQNN